MQVFISNLNGISGTAKIAFDNVASLGRSLGFRDLNLYCLTSTSFEPDEELNKRMDGIVSGLFYDDVVILQFPFWSDMRYNYSLMEHITAYNCKVIIFVHDLRALMFDWGEENLLNAVKYLNRADVLILPSKAMHDLLITKGLTVEKIVYQEVWDYPMNLSFPRPTFKRRLIFTGDAERFPFVNDWTYETDLDLYSKSVPKASCEKVHYMGYTSSDADLFSAIARGGVGLVWATDGQLEYYKYNQPFKAGTFLAAGVPIIAQHGTNIAGFIEKHDIGYVVDSLDEVDRIMQSMTEREYKHLLDNIRGIQFLIQNGYYTRRALLDAVDLSLS